MNKRACTAGCRNMIVLGLEHSATDDDLLKVFSKHGDLSYWEVKRNPGCGESRRFGFIRYEDVSAQEKVRALRYFRIRGKVCEVDFPRK